MCMHTHSRAIVAVYRRACMPYHNSEHACLTIPATMHASPYQRPCMPHHTSDHACLTIPASMHASPYQRPCMPHHTSDHACSHAPCNHSVFCCAGLWRRRTAELATNRANMRLSYPTPPHPAHPKQHHPTGTQMEKTKVAVAEIAARRAEIARQNKSAKTKLQSIRRMTGKSLTKDLRTFAAGPADTTINISEAPSIDPPPTAPSPTASPHAKPPQPTPRNAPPSGVDTPPEPPPRSSPSIAAHSSLAAVSFAPPSSMQPTSQYVEQARGAPSSALPRSCRDCASLLRHGCTRPLHYAAALLRHCYTTPLHHCTPASLRRCCIKVSFKYHCTLSAAVNSTLSTTTRTPHTGLSIVSLHLSGRDGLRQRMSHHQRFRIFPSQIPFQISLIP